MPGDEPPVPRWEVREYNYAQKQETFLARFRAAARMERCFRTLLTEHHITDAEQDIYVRRAMVAFTTDGANQFEAIIGLYAITITRLSTSRHAEKEPQ